jgi:hypothetical protein
VHIVEREDRLHERGGVGPEIASERSFENGEDRRRRARTPLRARRRTWCAANRADDPPLRSRASYPPSFICRDLAESERVHCCPDP